MGKDLSRIGLAPLCRKGSDDDLHEDMVIDAVQRALLLSCQTGFGVRRR